MKSIHNGIEFTGSIITDAFRLCDCPLCGAKAGERCTTPKGRKTEQHGARGAAFNKWTDSLGIDPARIPTVDIMSVIRGDLGLAPSED